MTTGEGDRFSDIDIYILVNDEDFDELYNEKQIFAGELGNTLFTFEMEWPNCMMYGVILENFLEVDLCYCVEGQIEILVPTRL
jgi:predicted nucleotidyltransferase